MPGKGESTLARRPHKQKDVFQQVLPKIQRIIDSPLKEVGGKLADAVATAQFAAQYDATSFDPSSVAKDINSMIGLFPGSFGERFLFDCVMIQSTVETLSEGGLRLNNMIVPTTGKAWGHDSLPLPWENQDKINVIDFIHIPGEDEVDAINLLSYPFLIHEMGHNIFFRYDSVFTNRFKERLEKITNDLRLASIADRGAAHSKAQIKIEETRKLWTPTPTHKNWAHELAIDIVALWVCGPAYLAAFQDEMEEPNARPYQVGQTHPPNAVRASALAKTGDNLGWGKHTGGLDRVVQKWRQSQWNSARVNRNQYVTFTNIRLIEACVASALETCEALRLPRCSENTIERLRECIGQGETPDFGTDAIIAAWLVREEQGERAYEQWEAHTVHDLLQYITP
jgi:hypothetical protein